MHDYSSIVSKLIFLWKYINIRSDSILSIIGI
nr:MAG TPA: hypothetical protein [Caudoviricetes sp.]